jgi:hypothetical protein
MKSRSRGVGACARFGTCICVDLSLASSSPNFQGVYTPQYFPMKFQVIPSKLCCRGENCYQTYPYTTEERIILWLNALKTKGNLKGIDFLDFVRSGKLPFL